MKKKIVFLLALSVILTVAVTMNGTLAYFTSYAEATGGHIIDLGSGSATINFEKFDDWTHRVFISNSEQGRPIYVRARAFAGGQYQLTYTGTGWTLGSDGYYYYGEILNGGEATTRLNVKIENVPQGTKGDSFNVVIVYETTPVQYDEQNGTPYADWTIVMEGGNEG